MNCDCLTRPFIFLRPNSKRYNWEPKKSKWSGVITGAYVSGFLHLENFSQDLLIQLLTVPCATLTCLNTQSCEENPKPNPKRGLCSPSSGASRQAESRQHQVMGHDGFSSVSAQHCKLPSLPSFGLMGFGSLKQKTWKL